MMDNIRTVAVEKSIFIGLCLILLAAGDPCQEENFIELDHLSKRSPKYAMDSVPLCDMYLKDSWYRGRAHTMTSSPPTLTYCGTLYPIWLKDPAPAVGVTQTLKACQVGFKSDCEKAYKIDVKNCTQFLVYKLKPVDMCNSAYCFELDDDCIKESVSNVAVSFQRITWKENKKPDNPNIIQYLPTVNLVCSFIPASDDSLLYHIDWYADRELILRGQTLDKPSLINATLSTEQLAKASKKLGTWVHCVVGTKTSVGKHSCVSIGSPLFFAGIEMMNETLTIERNGETTLKIRPTIPFAGETILVEGSKQGTGYLQLDLSFPESLEGTCKATGNLKQCSVKIEGFTFEEKEKYNNVSNWHYFHEIKVHNSDERNYYLTNQRLVLRMKTNRAGGDGADFYRNVALPDVHINVVEKTEVWKGKRCSSYADPHQRTFDGYAYECQSTGCLLNHTYIMYRNEDYMQEIQVQHGRCWGKPRCICAVAARSGQDVFIINTCDGKGITNFPICNDKSLKVIREKDRYYEIIFPTGTSAKARLYRYGSEFWIINLEIYPTISDFNRTSGLCGVLDNNAENDLTWRNSSVDDISKYSYYNPPDEFSKSWILSNDSEENFFSKFVYDKLTSLSAYFHKLCTCKDNKTSCSYMQYHDCKTEQKGVEYECFLHSSPRRKRDLKFVLMNDNSKQPHLLKEQNTRQKRNVFTQQDALKICNTAFEYSTYFNTCLEFVPNFSNDSLTNCVNDIMMTGNVNLTTLHVETALGQCQAYILLNSTFEKGFPDIASGIINECQNNCSDHGICNEGNCTCYDGYGGSDCSFDTRLPPTITHISDKGLCDISEERCDEITLYGQYFVENMGTTCFMTRMTITPQNSILTQQAYAVALEERTMFEGFCSLYYDPIPSWATFFNFTLSNDGTTSTDMFSVYVYQSQCQILNNDTGKIYITLQDGYCYIEGSCIQEGYSKSNESCLQCIPTLYQFDWSWVCHTTDVMSSSELPMTNNDSDEKFLTTLGIVVSIIIFALIGLTIAACIVKGRYKSSHYQVTNPEKSYKDKEVNIYSTRINNGNIYGKSIL